MKHEDDGQLLGDLRHFARYGAALHEGCSRVETMLARIKANRRLREARTVVARSLASDKRDELLRAQELLRNSLADLLTK